MTNLEGYHLNTARHHLFQAMEMHEAGCLNPECPWKGNVLAWIAHCLGANEEDVKTFKRLLVDYELRCQSGKCEVHQRSDHERRESHERGTG